MWPSVGLSQNAAANRANCATFMISLSIILGGSMEGRAVSADDIPVKQK